MAKGSIFGVKRGKLGDVVLYEVTNSADKDKQGWRPYKATIRNPQTDGQIDQRIKLTAANNLYRALKPIIQRGWENHKYGDESRRAFLKRALGSAFVGPYLPKGSTLAVPIEGVPITYGSLTPVVVECGNAVAAITNVPYTKGVTGTIGSLSQLYISAGLAQPGDQVTYIFASLNGAGTVSYLTRSFYVDPNSAEEAFDVLGFYVSSTAYDDNTVLAVDVEDLGLNTTAFAALVSISRDGETSNLRSYAEFDMTSEFREYFYGTTAQQEAAKASYRKKVSSSTNWPLDPGSGDYTPTPAYQCFTRSGVAITPVSMSTKEVGSNIYRVIVDNEGVEYYCQSRDEGAVVWLTAAGFSSSAPTGATTANSCDPYDSANRAVDLRAWLISKGVPAANLPAYT